MGNRLSVTDAEQPCYQPPFLTEDDVWLHYEKAEDEPNGSFLGKGGFGEVYKVRPSCYASRQRSRNDSSSKESGIGTIGTTTSNRPEVFAIKVVDVKRAVADMSESEKRRLLQEVLHEAEIWRNFDHPNIAKFYGFRHSKGSEVMVMELELADGGDFNNFLMNRKTPLDDFTKKTWCFQLLSGLQALHKADIVHRDISANNVLMFGNGERATLKISDFGLARSEYKTGFVPTKYFFSPRAANPNYAPPEFVMEDGQPRDKLSDIWSLGIVFFFMEELRLPFDCSEDEGGSHFGIYAKIHRFSTRPWPLFSATRGGGIKPGRSSQLLRNMVERMVVPERSKRLPAKSLMHDKSLWPDQALQIVACSSDRQQPPRMVLNDQAFAEIVQRSEPSVLNLPAVVVSMCGSLRSGKSLLMSLFIRYLELLEELDGDHDETANQLPLDDRPLTEFRAQSGFRAATNGIFMWSRPFQIRQQDGSKAALYLMDTEGARNRRSLSTTDDVIDEDVHEIRALSLASIVSSIQLYNVKDGVTDSDLSYIEQFSNILRKLERPQIDGLRRSNRGGGGHQKKPIMQRLLFVVRDYFDVEDEYGFNKPAGTNNQQTASGMMVSFFEKVDFYAMPIPNGRARNKAHFDNRLKISDLNGEDGDFIGCATKLFRWIIENAKPLGRGRLENMNFFNMEQLMKDYAKTIGESPANVHPLCEALAQVEYSNVVNELFQEYERQIDEEEIQLRNLLSLLDHYEEKTFSQTLKATHLKLKQDAVASIYSLNLPMKHRFIGDSIYSLESKIDQRYNNKCPTTDRKLTRHSFN